MALRLATGWEPNDAEVIIGTSSGAFTAALVRGGRLDLDVLVGDARTRQEVADRLRVFIYRRGRPRGVRRWLRRGVFPGLRRPSLNLVVGSPAIYRTDGLAEWVAGSVGAAADGWPTRPTVLVGYDLVERRRAPFGTEAAPDVSLRTAVAASTAVPFMFEPVEIDGHWYIDGGVVSGTNADLLLAAPEPLDLVVVLAPFAASEARSGSRFYEEVFDRVGRTALADELDLIRDLWPDVDVLVLRPALDVLEVARPNPLAVQNAVPTFLRTLRSMHSELAQPETWELLDRHFGS